MRYIYVYGMYSIPIPIKNVTYHRQDECSERSISSEDNLEFSYDEKYRA